MTQHLAANVVTVLAGEGLTLATAESLTGGQLAALVTGVPGASAVFRGGVVAYATELKHDLLGVENDLLTEQGAVSAACAMAMAQGVRSRLGADIGLSTTGVAGPDPSEGHPVGTVFVAVAARGGSTVVHLRLRGDRGQIQGATCDRALGALWAMLRGEETVLG